MTTTNTLNDAFVIPNVNCFAQREDKIFSFVIPAELVVSLSRVERFGTDPNGVNRKFDENHALSIADAMLDHSLLWLEPILGDLSGGKWSYDEAKRELTVQPGGYISIDDGQHRWHALSVLNQSERDHLQFTVTATMDLPFERRLKIFRSQNFRKKIDARLDLAQRHKLGDWKNDTAREAYELILMINSETTSPLKGMILLEEQDKRPHEGRHRPIGINGNGLHTTMRSVIGSNSPLSELSSVERKRVILDLIQLSANLWPKEWKSDKHILTTARGINAILMLVVSSPNFRGAIGDDFSMESLQRGLNFVATFKWEASGFRNASVREIVARLDQSLGRNKRAKLRVAA